METIVAEKVQKEETKIREVYERTFPRVAAFVSRIGGTYDDARDIFHDSLLIYFELKSRDVIHTSEDAYILGIAKHLWIRRHKQERQNIPLNGFEKEIPVPEDSPPSIEEKRLLRILESAGKKCMDLLRAFYFRKSKLQELASSEGYSGKHSLSVQKYKCLGKVRNIIREKALRYDDFIE